MQLRIIHPLQRLSNFRFTEGDQHPLIREIQQRLAEIGLYRYAANGNYDASTTEAISYFQQVQGLPATGVADPVTYCRLCNAITSEINTTVKPRAIAAHPRANILITKSERRLSLFNGNAPLRQFPIAIGKPSTPTPEGNFAIATKIINPGGVLGSRWMGLNFGAYGIHGTNAPWLIGQMVSNGCIRMHNSNAEELFQSIGVGTPVFIRN